LTLRGVAAAHLCFALAVALGACAPKPAPVTPREAPTPPPVATPEPLASPSPTPAPQPPSSRIVFPEVAAPRLDVSIQTDVPLYVLPHGDWLFRSGDRVERRVGSFQVFPPQPTGTALFVVQAGSLASREAAEREKERIATALGVPVNVAENAGRFAVRVGTPEERRAAEVFLARVRREATPDAFLVPSAAPAPSGGLEVKEVLGGASSAFPSPLEIATTGGAPIPIGASTYRGNLVLRATSRGTLHAINRVAFESYLKGVVPGEMGPVVFNEPDALKAQAVAARSYAYRRLGDFAAEGYDLCATPRCQVYSGVSVEQTLSDRAVDDTAGEVLLWGGQVADALFTSTCGGKTERAVNVFPGYAPADYPYLSPVLCTGEEPFRLKTSSRTTVKSTSLVGTRGLSMLAALARSDVKSADLGTVRAALTARLGQPAPAPLKSFAPAAVYADLHTLGAFGDTATLLEEVELGAAPASWPVAARTAFALVSRFQLGGALPVERALRPEEAAGLWTSLLARLGAVEEVEGRLVAANETEVTVKTSKGRTRLTWNGKALLFRGQGDSWSTEASLVLYPGDRGRLLVKDGEAWGLVATIPGAAGTFERESTWIHWTRRFTAAELMSKLKERDASRKGTLVSKVEVLERGESRRAKKVRVTTDQGTVVLNGLEVRFSLALPESLFNLTAGKGDDGKPVFTFYGRGWGHGVGLCQHGAFGMALAGRTYRDILQHYYPGASLGPAPVR